MDIVIAAIKGTIILFIIFLNSVGFLAISIIRFTSVLYSIRFDKENIIVKTLDNKTYTYGMQAKIIKENSKKIL